VVVNSSNPTDLGATRDVKQLPQDVSPTVWDCVRRYRKIRIPLSCIGFRDWTSTEKMPQRVRGNSRQQTWMSHGNAGQDVSVTNYGFGRNHKQAGILAWVIGDRRCKKQQSPCGSSSECWHCFFMSPMAGRSINHFIEEGDRRNCQPKTYMTRVRGKTLVCGTTCFWLRRKTSCYSSRC